MTRISGIRIAVACGLLALASCSMQGQQTTTTNCNVAGNNVNCTSNTTDYGAQQRQAYENGQQIGNALGSGLAIAMQAHSQNKWVKHFCEGHPGGSWHWTRRSDGAITASGNCPTDSDKSLIAANEFMAHHREYIKEADNSKVLVAYLEEHKLDPRVEKSYEKAFKDLRKSRQIELYAK